MFSAKRRYALLGATLATACLAIVLAMPGPPRHALWVAAKWVLPTPARVATLTVLGRNDCGWSDGLRAVADTEAERRIIDRLSGTGRLVQNDPKGFDLWQTGHGMFWILSGSEMPPFFHMLAEQELRYYWGPGVDVRKGDVVLDCGANYGVFTRAALARGASLVVAVEPVPENVECLRRTFAGEIQAGRVIVVPKGVWDSRGTMTLQVDPRSSWGAHVVAARPDRESRREELSKSVDLVPIDELVSELGLSRVDFIKMDIEGAERNALAGAQRTLASHRPRVAVCVYHRPDDMEEIPKRLPEFYSRVGGHCEDNGNSIRREVLLFF